MKTLFYIASIFITTLSLNAQVTVDWHRQYGGTYADYFSDLKITDENKIIIGSSSKSSNIDVGDNNGKRDFWLVQTDEDGNIEWEKNYGGSENEYLISLDLTQDGGYILAGYTESNDGDVEDFKGDRDWWVVKTDEDGNVEWAKTYGGSDEETFLALHPMEDGGFLLGGESRSEDGDVGGNNGKRDWWIVKIDEDGDIEWEQNYGTNVHEPFRTFTPSDDGNFILAGHIRQTDCSCYDLWIMKIDLLGNTIWENYYGTPDGELVDAIIKTSDNGALVVARNSEFFNDDVWLFKLDEEGNIQWENTYGGTSTDYIQNIYPTQDNGFLLSGGSFSDDGDLTENNGGTDNWIFKIDENGQSQWHYSTGTTAYESIDVLEPIDDKNFIIGGDVSVGPNNDNTYGESDIWVKKITIDEAAPIQADLKIFLEGAFDTSTNQMKTTLQDLNLLPLQQPFQSAPYEYDGNEQVDSADDLPDNVVDWVLVEVREGTPDLIEAQTTLVERTAALLLADGSIVNVEGQSLTFDNLVLGTAYHFLIRHRNHLDIISSQAVAASTQMQYDFTSDTDQAFGSEQLKELSNGKAAMFVGDYTQDGIIQLTDYDVWVANPAQNNVYQVTDGTLDGVVQNTDSDAWIPNKAKLGTVEIQF